MIYHCEDHTCNYWDEGEKLPERCPQCGRKLLRANEAALAAAEPAGPVPALRLPQ